MLYVRQADGRRMRAELPMTADSGNQHLKAHLYDLFRTHGLEGFFSGTR